MYAKRCLEYVETIEHGTRVLRLLKEKDKSMSVGKSFTALFQVEILPLNCRKGSRKIVFHK